MKKLLAVFGITATLVVGGDVLIQTKGEVANIIDIEQAKYFAENGEYFQVLAGRQKPSDQTKTWTDIMGAKVKDNPDYEIIIDVYETKEGKGYTTRLIDKTATTTK